MGTRHTKQSNSTDSADKTGAGYEISDVKPRGIVIFGGILLLLMILTMVFVSGLTDYFEGLAEQRDQPLSPLIESQPTVVGPRLQDSPSSDMEAFRLQQQKILNSYDWIDKSNGTVRIPIERAMELIAMDPAKYEQGVTGSVSAPTVMTGEQIFEKQGCTACHRLDGSDGAGPSLVGKFGKSESLQDDKTVVVDEEYIRNSILVPNQDIVAGYQPIMPAFQDRLTEEEIVKLIDYIKSLGE